MPDQESFSKRFGIVPTVPDITIREDAPEDFRYALLRIAYGDVKISASNLRDIVCDVFRKRPDPNNWSDGNVYNEVESLLYSCEWYRVYDITEAIYRFLAPGQYRSAPLSSGSKVPLLATKFQELVNQALIEMGIGWQLVNGMIQTRGDECFEAVVKTTTASLNESHLSTAKTEIAEAIRDLSRRPTPDLSGTIQHAVAGLESVVREIAQNPKATLGELATKRPELFPAPLDNVVTKVWGYSSEAARHGREGRHLERAEAELVAGLSLVLVSYLLNKLKR